MTVQGRTGGGVRVDLVCSGIYASPGIPGSGPRRVPVDTVIIRSREQRLYCGRPSVRRIDNLIWLQYDVLLVKMLLRFVLDFELNGADFFFFLEVVVSSGTLLLKNSVETVWICILNLVNLYWVSWVVFL